jgi:predicted permease
MPVLAQVNSLVRNLFRKPRIEKDLDDEIGSHLELLTDQKIEEGMNPRDARRAACIELGGVEQIKENVRAVRAGLWLETVWQDLRFGVRVLRKNPGFTTVAVLTLALGIGANTAIFSVVESVLLAPLHYYQSDRLVIVWQTNRFPRVAISYPNFLDWQRNAHSFQQMTGTAQQEYDLTSPGTSERVDGAEISSGFFSTLGVKLILGREFSPQEDWHGGAPVVIISNHLWISRFDSSPEILSKSVTLNGVNYSIVGVTAPGFHFEADADVYTPLAQGAPVELNDRSNHWIACIARLKPGVTISQAQGEINAIQQTLDRLYPEADRDLGTLKQQIVGDVVGTLLVLLGAVALVLLTACANVANLLLARSAARKREFGIRSALGANRVRFVRQLLTESVLLSLAGGVLGVSVAALGVRLMLAVAPGTLPRRQEISLNLAVLLFTLGIAVAAGVLFGLVPAFKSSKSNLQGALRESDRASSSQHRVQSAFVIIQMAVTLVLLVGSGLLLRTIHRLAEVNPGFDTQHILTFKVGVSSSLTKTVSATRIAYEQLIERIRTIPGVQAADFTDVVPLTRQGGTMPFWIGSLRPASLQEAPRLVGFLTGPDYLQTMGIPLLRGRFFTLEDTGNSPCVVVIDSIFARMYFQDSDPIGQMLSFGFTTVGPCQIVGVVGHVRDWELSDPATRVQNQVYFPFYQDPDAWVPLNYPDATVMVRTQLDTATVIPAIKAAVFGASSDQPVYRIRPIQDIVAESMSTQRFPMIVLGAFAASALLLASVGIYGVISYSVTQRVREIGIRMALGAKTSEILRMVIAQSLRVSLTGLMIGASVALILTRLLSSFSHLLYGVGTNDPLTFVATSLVLTAVAVLACYVPARRATRIDPTTALRHE